jgi:hypothetical protein
MIRKIHFKKHQNRVDYVKRRPGNLAFLEEGGGKESLPVVGTRSKIIGMA